MSEYQYYQFLALDRPLTVEAQKKIKSLSSRVQLTPSSASFVYNYSDLPADPYEILAEYFDAMLYLTNWGTRQLMFRFPTQAISQEVQKQYIYPYAVEWSSAGQNVILNIQSNPEEGGGEWVEGEGILSGIVQIRNDILRGDLRALYLAWLKSAHEDLNPRDATQDNEWDDDTDFEEENLKSKEAKDFVEPPVPPNLQDLSDALENFIAFLKLDGDLVRVAAQVSPTTTQSQADHLVAYIPRLSQDEKENFLTRLLQGEVQLDIALANRLREFEGPAQGTFGTEKRTIHQLAEQARMITQQRLEQERHKREIEKAKHLETVAQKESQLWSQVFSLIEERKTKAYDQAVAILKDLRDLAEYEKRLSEFHAKVSDIQAQYSRLTTLLRCLDKARLI